MNRLFLPTLTGLILLSACAHPYRLQDAPGAAALGVPHHPGAAASIALSAPPKASDPVRLPDRITLPGAYRLVLLEGHLTLVRETDAQMLSDGTDSLRIVVGNASQGELAFQPALLPQELARELEANRESTTRMDKALGAVMERSRELSKQALELEAQSARIAEWLARQSRVEGAPAPTVTPTAGDSQPASAPAN